MGHKIVKLRFLAKDGSLVKTLRRIKKVLERVEREGLTECKRTEDGITVELERYNIPDPLTPYWHKEN